MILLSNSATLVGAIYNDKNLVRRLLAAIPRDKIYSVAIASGPLKFLDGLQFHNAWQ